MKKAVVALMMIMAVFSMPMFVPETVNAAGGGGCETSIFGLRPWYQGLVDNIDGRCVIKNPQSEEDIPQFVWTIVLNILFDLFAALGVVSTGFVIMGGYWYIRSGGDPNLVERGKKTLTAAIIGTVIALLSTVITNFLTTILVGGGS